MQVVQRIQNVALMKNEPNLILEHVVEEASSYQDGYFVQNIQPGHRKLAFTVLLDVTQHVDDISSK